VILAKFSDFVVVAKVAMVAIFPNVASIGVEERVVTPVISELDTGVGSLGHDGLRLKNWFQCEHRKKQSDDRENRLGVKVNAHLSASNLCFRGSRDAFPYSTFEADRSESLKRPYIAVLERLSGALIIRMVNRP
jgi:hypothetical protein